MRNSIPFLILLFFSSQLMGLNTAGPVFQLSPFNVEETGVDDDEIILGIGYIEAGEPDLNAISLANVIEEGRGVTMQRRGSGSLEPNLRGFNLDRVTVSFNGLMLPAASPTRTASPVNFFSASGITEVMVVTGLPSVTDGPVPVGGRIEIRTDAVSPVLDQLSFSLGSNPGGYRSSATGNLIQNNQFSLQAGIHYADFDSYKSGSPGLEVDETFKGWGTSGALAFRQKNGNRFDFAVNFFRQVEARNTSLPLDSMDADAIHISSGYRASIGDGELQVNLGYSETTPFLSSENRIIPEAAPLKSINAGSESKSSSLKVGYKVSVWESSMLEIGLDHVAQTRDATRIRSLKSGAVIEDTIWPDVNATHPGCFIELISERNLDFEWRIGARVGKSTTEAKAAGNAVRGIPGSMGPTVIDNYIAYNGSDAARTKASDWTSGANAIGQWWISNELRLMAGAGITVAPPGVGERYRAFLNALGGGVELGNPALDPETKRSVSLGLAYTTSRLNLSSEIWYADVEDYVTRMAVSTSPLIYSFRNQDATFSGVDLNLIWKPFEETQMQDIRFTAALTVVDGENEDSGKDVVEIPPWDCSLGVIWEQSVPAGDLSMKLTGHYVDAAMNPDPALNPVYKDTSSWFSLQAEVSLRRENWLFRLVMDNAFDRLGYAYLQPPVATGPILPAGGDLSPGDRIPLPGRSVSLQISYFY
ncbi:MAG: TonB-dependent receptor [Puniceicoccaceae bacterium]